VTIAAPETNDSTHDCLTSDSDAGDDEEDSDEDDEMDDDNDWSQDGDLEAIILKAVGEDLALAAYLIPILHRSLRSGSSMNANEIGSWRYSIVKGAMGNNKPGGEESPTDLAESTNNNSRKRRRQGDSSNQRRKPGGFGEEGEDDEDEDFQDFRASGDEGQQSLPRLACPFHKRDPEKYRTQHGEEVEGQKNAKYRACGGPGFKSIPRLKYVRLSQLPRDAN
jgi:hypothetical protein